ncbi:YybH family protein [methane-oxidizing endosymbiont of Gigantopelta aegis]|uniref:YybH family protein n=1 Tax=methane-oxidizing endosymbiont of Gigantopelta aegis TaxID=2794938 RepID=UPI001FD8CC97|nr:nuclear transport factor 2 family protein [methane-oxidizing endosymbiont of Gigantopelta aegis]
MDNLFAQQFARECEHAWNSHDIDNIMQHYADDIVLVSPIAAKLLDQAEVKGKDAVRRYFIKG